MNKEIVVCNMRKEDIGFAINLWVTQYQLYCNNEEFPQYWKVNEEEIRRTFEMQIQNHTAVIAKRDEKIVGCLGYYEFNFHNEKSALCNITSHTAEEKDKEQIYLALYKHVSKLWIEKNIFNHLWMFFYQDVKLQTFLYDLGFGSYVVDAYSGLNMFDSLGECPYQIRLATLDDLPLLQMLVDESTLYYSIEPLFLKREAVLYERLQELIRRNNIFIACDGDRIIGFINVNRAEENDTENLSVVNCGMIDGLGAYIKPEYRGNKLGAHLLNAIAGYCKDNSIDIVHVDFETANPFANKFWRKYFTPMILSVRRTINKDINM